MNKIEFNALLWGLFIGMLGSLLAVSIISLFENNLVESITASLLGSVITLMFIYWINDYRYEQSRGWKEW